MHHGCLWRGAKELTGARIQVKILRSEPNLIQLWLRHAIEAATYQSPRQCLFCPSNKLRMARVPARPWLSSFAKPLVWLRHPGRRSFNPWLWGHAERHARLRCLLGEISSPAG
jgi:hypothetical protein